MPPPIAPNRDRAPVPPEPSKEGNGGPGRLASDFPPDGTVDPSDSGGKPGPADPNHIAPSK